MNLDINPLKIEESFDRIAKELLLEKGIYINDKIFRFTEIEFYYFNEELHPDEYTHEHSRAGGQWRFHNQGIDITLPSQDKIDGGILIRGISVDQKYINGPRKVINAFFEAFGSVINNTHFVLKECNKRDLKIIKTFRHLPNKIKYPHFHTKHYRYIVEFEKTNILNNVKGFILKDHQILK